MSTLPKLHPPQARSLPAGASTPDQFGVPLNRRERQFFLLLSTHRFQRRSLMQLDLDLCDLARAHAEREIARQEPESILLFLWKTALRDDFFPGLTSSYTMLGAVDDNPHNALGNLLNNPADNRHLLGANNFFRRQSRIGVGYATDPRGEAACYVFISVEPSPNGTA